MPKVISSSEFVELMKPGMKVFIQGCTAEPPTLLEALTASPECSRGVEYVGVPLPGYNRFDPAALHEEARMTTFFMTPELRRSPAAERIRFIPLHYSGIYRFLRSMPDLDMLLVQSAAGDRDGLCSFGLTSEHAPGALESARTVVVEMNSAVPYTHCEPALPLERIDYIVESNRAPPTFPSPQLGEQAEAVGRHAATLIRDGDVLQIGIGRLQSAVMRELHSHKDLGFHSGLISDETLELVECGALTGARKSIDPGIIVTGAVFGSERLHEFSADPSVRMHGVSYTHEVPVIATIENFVSINGGMMVDLYGQVVADNLVGRQISAPGGYSDFQRGARLAKGGRSIILMTGATPDASRSNIIPCLPEGSVITGTRSDTDYIVTDHGVADLRHKDIDEKAEAIIEIAHPAFREELERNWRARSY
ncbi:MAG: acetyl-CoA hydrolase/transferase C-terminal domain-containing protein [Pseudomonadota bacterium]